MIDRDSLRQILAPTWFQTLICLLLTLGILLLANTQVLTRFLSNTGLLENIYIQQVISANLSAVSRISAVNIGVIILFWSAVYLVVYTLFWFLTNVMVEARNELIIETEFTNQSSLTERFRTPLLQLLLGLILISFILASFFFGFPNWLSLMQNAVLNITSVASIAYMAIGMLACMLNIYALWSLTQVVFAVD